MEPKSSVAGYMASRAASRGVGRNGDPAIGASTMVAVRFEEALLDTSGTGISTLVATLRVAILRTSGYQKAAVTRNRNTGNAKGCCEGRSLVKLDLLEVVYTF